MYIEPQDQKKKKRNIIPFIIGGVVLAAAIVTGIILFLNREIDVKDINVPFTDIELFTGETKEFKVEVVPNNTTEQVNVVVSNDIITLENGVIKANRYGNSTITIKSKNVEKVVNVNVYSKLEDYKLNIENISLGLEDSIKIKPTFLPVGSKEEKLTYQSLNEDIVTVSNGGTLTPVSCGKAIIVTVSESGIKKETPIYIVTKGVTILIVDTNEVVFDLSKDSNSYQIIASVEPNDATIKEIEYTSSNEDVAIVSKEGLISPIGFGKCVITVKASNGQTEDVNVLVTAQAETINLKEDVEYKIWLDDTFDLYECIEITPIEYKDAYNITYTSSNTNLIKVDQNGIVTAVSDIDTTNPIPISITLDNGLETTMMNVDFYVSKAILWVNGFPKNSNLSRSNPSFSYAGVIVLSVTENGVLTSDVVSDSCQVVIQGDALKYVTIDSENCLVTLNDFTITDKVTGKIKFVYTIENHVVETAFYNFEIN